MESVVEGDKESQSSFEVEVNKNQNEKPLLDTNQINDESEDRTENNNEERRFED